jgi:hypothetical protein
MNRHDQILGRLFRAARSAPRPEIGPIPHGLKTRVLAQWRSAVPAEDPFLLLALLFRRALIGAAVVMCVCVLWSFEGLISPPENDVALANYEVREGLLP